MYKSALKEYQKSRSKISPETKSWFQSWRSQPNDYHVLGGIPSASNPITGFTKAREKDAVYSRLGEEQWETNTMQCKWSPTPSKRRIARQAGFGMLELQCKTGRLLVNSFSTASTSDIRSKYYPPQHLPNDTRWYPSPLLGCPILDKPASCLSPPIGHRRTSM